MVREDWVDQWFEIQHELGIDVMWRLGSTVPGDTEPTWQDIDHRRFDGVGAFLALLRREGWPVNEIPRSSEAARPGFFRMLVELLRQARAKRNVEIVPWLVDTGKQDIGSMVRFCRGFSEDESARIRANAKNARVSVNEWLLFHLNRASQAYLVSKPGPYVWVVPVNLRGPWQRKDPTSNHVSFFPLRIDPAPSVGALRDAARKRLAQKSHWLSWYFVNLLGKTKGIEGLRRLVQQNLDSQRSVIGVFSNLGSWPQPLDFETMSAFSVKTNERRTWFVSPNNTPSVPVAGGAITWFGRLGLTVQVHPRVTSDQDVGRRILDAWVSGVQRRQDEG